MTPSPPRRAAGARLRLRLLGPARDAVGGARAREEGAGPGTPPRRRPGPRGWAQLAEPTGRRGATGGGVGEGGWSREVRRVCGAFLYLLPGSPAAAAAAAIREPSRRRLSTRAPPPPPPASMSGVKKQKTVGSELACPPLGSDRAAPPPPGPRVPAAPGGGAGAGKRSRRRKRRARARGKPEGAAGSGIPGAALAGRSGSAPRLREPGRVGGAPGRDPRPRNLRSLCGAAAGIRDRKPLLFPQERF